MSRLQALKVIPVFLMAFLTCRTVCSQSFYFRHYQVENGLSNNSVMCSLQDKAGFLWFGTKDGLNRFDGYAFKTFRRNDGKPGSIGNNFVHALCEDREGTLWVGTDKGLFRYLEKTEAFQLAAATANFFIDKILDDGAGNLWLISGFTLCRYTKQTDKLETYDPQKFFIATSFCTTPDGTVWVGTSEGQLMRYHSGKNVFTGFDLFGHSATTNSRWIESLCTTNAGRVLAGTSNTEFKLVEPFGATYTDISLPVSGQANLYIRSIKQTTPDEFWLGTESGVFVYNQKTGKSLHLKKDYNNPYSISDNAIYTFCRDREGGVWVGTYFGGLNYYPNPYTPFERTFPRKGENSLGGNVVREIKKDRYGNFWIGTEDAGLNKLDPSTGLFTRYQPNGTPSSISFFNIHGLLATGDELWVGTFHHGLDILNIRTGKVVRHFDAGSESGLTHNFIYSIYQNDSGRIYVTTPHGAFAYNRKQNRFNWLEGFPHWNWYSSVLQDDKGRIWAATFGNGLHSYQAATGESRTFTNQANDPHSISSNRINSIFEDSHHNLWFATEEGLCKWNEKSKNFTRYGTANGLPSDFIFCLLEDKEQNLWISTTKGLARFHPASGEVQVYTVANGLLGDQFNYSSAFKDTDGRLYFGSAKGLISFRPEEFSKSNFSSPVYLTGFQVNGMDITVGSNESPLKKSILYTDQITLNHHQSTFSVDFAALNYSAPEMIRYSYRMDGRSNKWVDLKKSRRVDFIELAPGTYTFRVKALNSDGIWSRETKLTIIILPPWWASTLAYAVYILCILLLVYYLVRSYHNRVEEKNKRRFEMLSMVKEKEILEMELAKEKELLQAKIEFFTNVAHEIKTPLTLIKVPLKKIIKKAGGIPEIENSLKIMDRNTSRLIELTGQLLDFRQTEINKFHLSFEQAEISGLVGDACSGFTTLAEQRNLSFSVRLPPKPFVAFVDIDAFNKIIYNLFSNAVKYADSQVDIALLPCLRNDHSFTIRVKNDGYLIPVELQEKVFEPFYRIRANENETGTGIGLALARSLTLLHNGTLLLDPPEDNMNVFSLTLPLHNEPEHTLQNKLFNSAQSTE